MENQHSKTSLGASFGWVIVSYALGLIAAIAIGYWSKEQGHHLLMTIGIADLLYTLVIFLFAYAFKNSSFYDPYWSVIPIFIVLYMAYLGWDLDAGYFRSIALQVLVSLWGIRLTWNWARGWQGLHHEDWRYVDLQEQTGKWYWLVSFSGIMMFPTILVFMGCLPFYPALIDSANPLNWLDFVGMIWMAIGIGFEFFADNQLRHFVLTNKEKGKSLTTGLWKYSRHPNYFGEVAFWWGIFIIGYAANPGYLWTIIGALGMTILFQFISIPMIEKRHWKRKKDYAEVVKRVPRWIPWFPKK